MSDSEQNNREPQGLDPELFKMLDTELREVFKIYAPYTKKPGNYNSHATHGLTVAQAAQALMQLHRDFKPGN